MTIFSGLSNSYTAILSNSHFFVEEGETVHGSPGAAFAFGGVSYSSLTVFGTVDGTLDDGVLFQTGASYDLSRIASTGVVRGVDNGVSVMGTDNRVINHGLITGESNIFYGIQADAARTEVINTGTVEASGGLSEGVIFRSIHGLLENEGRISAHFGVGFSGANGSELHNSGVIHGEDTGVMVLTGSTLAQLYNSGRIVGGGVGIAMLGDDGYLENSGVIKTTASTTSSVGPQAAVIGGDGVQEIANLGRIIGDVILGGGNDTYAGKGQGSVSGTVFGGAGADALMGTRGNDRFNGGDDTDILGGNGGADHLFGGGGDDTLMGGNGGDSLRGNAGDDIIDGESGADTLLGGGGADLLSGGAGGDVLMGGDGNDRLYGGAGDDTLRGGAGVDTFVYMNGIANFGSDRIVDFEDGHEKIDISAFGIDLDAFAANAVSAHNGNAIVDLSYLNPADLSQYSGTIVLVGQAGNIDAGDFL